MSLRVAVVHEAEADFRTATELADQVIVDAIDWVEDETIEHHREWIQSNPSGQRLAWKSIPKLARSMNIRTHGHFNNEPGMPDAATARRAILYLKAIYLDLDAILLIRDQDNQPERKDGLEQARQEHRKPPVIVIGLAVVERECWVLSGYEPEDEDERTILNKEIQNLGFDPCHRSHDLTACNDNQAKRSPKRLLKLFTRDDFLREQRCWKDTNLSLLHERGIENGLTSFLNEIKEHLVPLIGQ